MNPIQNNLAYSPQKKGDAEFTDLRISEQYSSILNDGNTVSLGNSRGWLAKSLPFYNHHDTLRDVHAGIINGLISINAQGGANGINADEVGRLSPDYPGQVIDLAQGNEKIINAVINHCNVNDQLLAKLRLIPIALLKR